ncbi:hypothetical protein LJR039_001634 [Pseudorhodoferax sp. LjRoot39]|uniref:hypothetical protein n=1 Tax=Pseudorhodoferax sp. LjRoot39 TaxID=3342328 RepID=UPI003ECFBFFF
MSASDLLYLLVLALLACAFPLAGYILIKERTANFQKIWDLAMAGHRLARIYMAVVILAFLLAVIGWFIALADHRTKKNVSSALSNNSLQRTATPPAELYR